MGAYGLDDARDYLVGRDVAVVLEEVADGTLDGCDGRVVPAYAAVFGADGEVYLVRHYHGFVCVICFDVLWW